MYLKGYLKGDTSLSKMTGWARCLEMYPSAKHPSKKPTVRPTYSRGAKIEPIDSEVTSLSNNETGRSA